jgi:hypothetical protein
MISNCMKYTKHKIQRVRELNKQFIEIVFERDSLQFVPGDAVRLYKNDELPIFIASGIQEPWVRIILRTETVSPNYLSQAKTHIKLCGEVESIFPTLMTEEAPAFMFDTETIGAMLSWSSTNLGVKCPVCYLGEDRIQEDWIAANHEVISSGSASKMGKKDNLYVSGRQGLFIEGAKKALAKCKGSLLIMD